MFERITSFQNRRLKDIRKLRERRERDRSGLFVIDYGRDLARALQAGYELDYCLVCPERMDADTRRVVATLPYDRVFQVTSEMMEKVGYRESPAWLLAVLRQKARLAIQHLPADVWCLLLLVNLKKPGNIGALLRTADVVGVDAIILVDMVLDLYNPNVIRSSTGACFLNNVYSTSTEELLPLLRQFGFKLVAAVVEDGNSMFEADLTGKVALALGTEDLGLSSQWIEAADERVVIPMIGQIADSLNVSVSGAVLLYEILRQRSPADSDT